MVFHPVELILALLVLAVVFGVLAEWLKTPYPILLVIGGILLGLQPGLPAIPARSPPRFPVVPAALALCGSVQNALA